MRYVGGMRYVYMGVWVSIGKNWKMVYDNVRTQTKQTQLSYNNDIVVADVGYRISISSFSKIISARIPNHPIFIFPPHTDKKYFRATIFSMITNGAAGTW